MKRAALVLATSVALFLSGAHAATRVITPETPFTNIMNAAQSAIGLPYGDAAFFGPEFTSEHTAGSRFQAGQSVPSSGTSGAKVKVAIKPVVTINAPKLAKSVASGLKAVNVPIILGTAAVEWGIAQIPGAQVKDGELTRTVQGDPMPVGTHQGAFYWEAQQSPYPRGNGPDTACQAYIATKIGTYTIKSLTKTSDTSFTCRWGPPSTTNTDQNTVMARQGTSCPSGGTFDTSTGHCRGTSERKFNDTDYAALEAAISNVTNSDWLRDLTKAKCAGGLSPESCYQDLVDRRPNHGPASQTVSSPAVTTTTTNPDGTTSTTTKTTSNKYDYTYTHNSYDYKVTTTTTTTTNGQTTTEVTTEQPSSPDEQPQEEPKEEGQEESMPEVTDLYKPYIDKLNDIKTDVAAPPAVVPSVGYSAWYSFGGGCSEINVDLPIIGSWSTSYCPYVIDWVRPILAFLFVVFTWHYCRELWSEAVTQARPM
jgi:hypothetical protein